MWILKSYLKINHLKLINLIKKLDAKLDLKEINQIAIFKANRLMVRDLIILDYEKTFRDNSS